MKSAVGAVLVLAISIFQYAHAWNYEEHVQITAEAHISACKALAELKSLQPQQKNSLQTFCENPLVAVCLGHMAALAGDRVADPESLVTIRKRQYLYSEQLDCTNILKPTLSVVDVTESGESLFKIRLIKSRLAQWINYADLASSNSAHFQPNAPLAWAWYFDKASQYAPDSSSYQIILATHSFAMHFLEDSFSAGHNGLDDRKRLRQDFDNAYHDDYNHTGIFLANSAEEWHTYGDGHLADSSYYVRFNAVDESSLTEAIEVVEGFEGRNTKNMKSSFERKVVSKLTSRPDEPRLVISLPLDSWDSGLLSTCYYIDSCQKLELIILSQEEPDPKNCPCVRKTERFEVFACSTSKSYVIKQAERSAMALLMHLIGYDNHAIEEKKQEIQDHFPTQYFPLGDALVDNALFGSGSINKTPLLLSYSQKAYSYCYAAYCRNPKPPERKFTNWGISVDYQTSSLDELEGFGAWWTIHKSFAGYGKGLITNRYEIVNDDGYFIDAFDMSVFSPSVRSPRNFLGMYLKGSAGLDNIWQGSERNAYAGAGLGVDAHFGKRILYLEVGGLRHWWTSEGAENSIRFILGIRGTSINLAPRRD